MSNGHRWSKFYWADWEADDKLRLCSLAAQGLWMRALCVMHKANGFLIVDGSAPNWRDLARIWSIKADQIERYFSELLARGVASKTETGVIFCRRMVNDIKASDEGREHIKKRWANGDPNRSPNRGANRDPNRSPISPDTDTDTDKKESPLTPTADAVGERSRSVVNPPKWGRRKENDNARAQGTNPRAASTNPRANGQHAEPQFRSGAIAAVYHLGQAKAAEAQRQQQDEHAASKLADEAAERFKALQAVKGLRYGRND